MPNVLLITADQMRADCLSAVGHPAVRAPRPDALAAGRRYNVPPFFASSENRRANLALSIITHLEHVGDIVDSEKSGERRYNFCAA